MTPEERFHGNTGLAHHALKLYLRRNPQCEMPREDLRQVAYMTLWKCCQSPTFDRDRGRFATYAVVSMLRDMAREAAYFTYGTYKPNNQKAGKARQMDDEADDFMAEYGRRDPDRTHELDVTHMLRVECRNEADRDVADWMTSGEPWGGQIAIARKHGVTKKAISLRACNLRARIKRRFPEYDLS